MCHILNHGFLLACVPTTHGGSLPRAEHQVRLRVARPDDGTVPYRAGQVARNPQEQTVRFDIYRPRRYGLLRTSRFGTGVVGKLIAPLGKRFMLQETSADIASKLRRTSPGFMTRLPDYSAEVTTPDRKSLDIAARLMPKDARVYVASLPKDPPDRQISVCSQVRDLGLIPVPHIVARNIADSKALNNLLNRLSVEAGVDRALILGGDRDVPAGDYDCSMQLIESGLLQAHGIDKIAIACYPEGHPRIPDDVLDKAQAGKIAAARAGGLSLILISQVCFESAPIIGFLRKIRAEGVSERVRVGVAGPAKHATLIRYAMICGVGASLRALRERQSLARNILSRETPEKLILELEEAVETEPSLNIWGIHFFTFASLKNTIEWVEGFRDHI